MSHVKVQYLSGEEITLGPFARMEDVSAEIARLHDVFIPDIVILKDGVPYQHPNIPGALTAIINERTYDADAWRCALQAHASIEDVAGVERAVAKLDQNKVASSEALCSQLFFSEGVETLTTFMISALINCRANANYRWTGGKTPLMAAASRAQSQHCRVFLEYSAAANDQDDEGRTALVCAASVRLATASTTEILLRAGAMVNLADNHKGTPLTYASAYSGPDELLSLILAKADVHHVCADGNNAIICAVQGRVAVASCHILIMARASVDHKNQEGMTALFYAAVGGDVLMCDMLLANGANVNHENKVGKCPLQFASHSPATSSVLVRARANIDHAESGGMTALSLAIMSGYDETCAFLISARANVNQSSDKGTPLFHAVILNSIPICQRLVHAEADVNQNSLDVAPLLLAALSSSEDMCRFLIRERADVNRISLGKTALIFAAGGRKTKICEILIAAHADVNYESNFNTPICSAAGGGDEEICRILIDAGAVVHSESGRPAALIYAAKNGHLRVCQILIDLNASVNYEDGNNETALIGACFNGHIEVAILLLESGADLNRANRDSITALAVGAQSDKQLPFMCLMLFYGGNLGVALAGLFPSFIPIRVRYIFSVLLLSVVVVLGAVPLILHKRAREVLGFFASDSETETDMRRV